MDPVVFPVLGLSVHFVFAFSFGPARSRRLSNSRPALSSVNGVAEVEVLGGRQAEIPGAVSIPARMQAHGLTPADVAQALNASKRRYRGRSPRGSLPALPRVVRHAFCEKRGPTSAHTVLKSGENGLVELDDVGDVQLGEAPEWTRVNADGKDAVLLNVKQQRGAKHGHAGVRCPRPRLAELKQTLPSDLKIANYYDQSDLIVGAAGRPVRGRHSSSARYSPAWYCWRSCATCALPW